MAKHEFVVEKDCLGSVANMKNMLAVLVFGSSVAALTMLAKSDFILKLLVAALRFAATVLSAFAWITIKFVV
jgi:hypothetical protein